MILMRTRLDRSIFTLFFAIFLTHPADASKSVSIPPCPEGTERSFIPSAMHPIWASCKDQNGLYQGLLIQFSGQTEIIRIAGVRDSLRQGREIRLGEPGHLEERFFQDGHLEGPSFIFPASVPLGRVFPGDATAETWAQFGARSGDSLLKSWLHAEPESSLEFQSGRLIRIRFGSEDFRFEVAKDGRIKALNHPEMKGSFFVDPEALFSLNAADTKVLLAEGFGSCRKFSGPLGRFGRHYDVLLFKRLSSEKKHLVRLNEIRERLLDFCVPKDLRSHLGRMECPPQLPGNLPPRFCPLPLSDRIRVPYDPKYFKFEFSLGHSPEEIALVLRKLGVVKFLSKAEQLEESYILGPKAEILVRKTPNGLTYKVLEKDEKGRTLIRKEESDEARDWWNWHLLPGI